MEKMESWFKAHKKDIINYGSIVAEAIIFAAIGYNWNSKEHKLNAKCKDKFINMCADFGIETGYAALGFSSKTPGDYEDVMKILDILGKDEVNEISNSIGKDVLDSTISIVFGV